jgi:hypothetical protein
VINRLHFQIRDAGAIPLADAETKVIHAEDGVGMGGVTIGGNQTVEEWKVSGSLSGSAHVDRYYD